MNKATFIRKYWGKGCDRNMLYMDYEYRGHEYTVYENRAKGSEPLSWQHKNHQTTIDRIIELEKKPAAAAGKPVDLDEIWDLYGWN